MFSDFDILRHSKFNNNSMQSVGLLHSGFDFVPCTHILDYYTNISDAVLLVTSNNTYISFLVTNTLFTSPCLIDYRFTSSFTDS